jgi:vesicle coat complex subunit
VNIIMTDFEIRDRQLDNFNSYFGTERDKDISEDKSVLIQKYSAKFESESKEAKICFERGDPIAATEHKLNAEMIDEFLKFLETLT